MSWMQKLYRTYEYVQEQGLDDEDLALPFHMSKYVQSGSFKSYFE